MKPPKPPAGGWKTKTWKDVPDYAFWRAWTGGDAQFGGHRASGPVSHVRPAPVRNPPA